MQKGIVDSITRVVPGHQGMACYIIGLDCIVKGLDFNETGRWKIQRGLCSMEDGL